MDAFSDERLRSHLAAAEELRQIEAEIRVARAAQKPMDGPEAVWQIFNSLQRRRRLILYTIAIGGILAILASIIVPPSYLSTAQLILDLRRPDASGTGTTGSSPVISSSVEDSAIDTHITTLLSDAHLRRTLRALRSADDDAGGATGKAYPDENIALARLRRGLKITQERRSRIISVSYNDPDPAKAAKVANTVAQVYVDSLMEEKRDDANLVVTRFTDRLTGVQKEVARAENEVHAYRQTHISNEASGPDQTEQQIAQTSRQLALVKSSAVANQKRLADFRGLRSGNASTLDLAKALDSPRLITMAEGQARQSKSDPATTGAPPSDLRRVIESEVLAAISRAEMEERTYQSQIQSLENRLDLLRRAAKQATDDTIGLQALERKASALGQLYETLLRQRENLIERSQLVEPEIRILALAEPSDHPSSLSRALLILPAFIAFALLGCMIALTRDRLDHTLHGERESTDALQVPCIGLIPEVTPRKAQSALALVCNSPGAPYSKAIRAIFSAIGPLCPTAQEHQEHKVILITSSVPGEGKTELAWSLGVSAAQFQWNVLIMEVGRQDAPARTEALSAIEFPMPTAALCDVMAQRSPLAAAVGSIPDSRISFLPLPSCDNGLLTLLANAEFSGLIKRIRDSYDLVIIDAPSIFDSAEVRLLSGAADKILFAVRWGKTRKETARSALQILQSTDRLTSSNGDKIVSILTAVNLKQHIRYRFSDQGDFLIKSGA